MTNISQHLTFIGALLLSISAAWPSDFNGEFSGLTNATSNGSEMCVLTLGIRYIPTFSMEFSTNHGNLVDFEVSGNLFDSFTNSAATIADTINIKPYRLWLRYSTNRFESRLGLQKITFGPAKLFRSLMWFDRLDPSDPLQLTEGVYGLRLRYDFPNNANVWLWELYGNNDPKGLELLPTKKKSPEFGGRFQYPTGNGEIALTIHQRQVKQADSLSSSEIVMTGDIIEENRIAVDGIWDVGPGVWFEAVIMNAGHKQSYPKMRSFLTLGADYTIGIGNGLTVLAEHFLHTMSDTPFDTDAKTEVSALMLSYPWGLIDQITSFFIYNWDTYQSDQYISWQRTYDQWIFHIGGFWSKGEQSFGLSESFSTLGKQGIQFIIIFNH